MDKSIHVAITRKVKSGMEDEFEKAVLNFFSGAVKTPGSLGAQLIKPLPGGEKNVYGIIRSFASAKDRDDFYQSDYFGEWDRFVKPFVEPEYSRKELHGLEAFFANSSIFQRPPRWKMAIVTWMGVWPSVFTVSKLVSPFHPKWPVWAAIGVDTLIVVLALTWVVMPLLTKLFSSWLAKPSSSTP